MVATTAPASIARCRPRAEVGLPQRHDQHEQHDRQADHHLRRQPRDRHQQVVDVGGQERARHLLGEDEGEERRADAVQGQLVGLGFLRGGAEAQARADRLERRRRGRERLPAGRVRAAQLLSELAHEELVAHVHVVDGRVDAAQQPADLVVGAHARARREVAGAHALDLVRELPEPRGQPRARHEVEQLQREEERYHQHHQHVEHDLEQHVVHERLGHPDVEHPERLPGHDRDRDEILRSEPRRLPGGGGVGEHAEDRRVAEQRLGAGGLPAVPEENAPVRGGERRIVELLVLLDQGAESLLDPVERVEGDAVARGLEQQRAHRVADGGGLLLGFRNQRALEHAVREVRNGGEPCDHAQHDHAGQLPVDAPEVLLLGHHRAAAALIPPRRDGRAARRAIGWRR
jgi:hypothetical protein